ncbi:MAG: hypothetical protein FOGNACKC_06090 [Anaerolineae bacterium]|nr:hypothetical protein [Anaerolineae bacterium]
MTAFYVPKGAQAHPYRLTELADMPPALKPAAQAAFPADERLDSIFCVPPQSFLAGWLGQRYVAEQALLFGQRGVLHVQAALEPGHSPQNTWLPASGLLSARLSILLLYGCFELTGEANGAPVTILVEFNTVGDHLLWPALRRLVQTAWGATRLDVVPRLPEREILTRLRRQSFKFNNGLQIHALQPEERLLGVVLQPAIWLRRWYLFNRQITPATLLALTDRQITIVEEQPGKHAEHGWIFNFFPLAGITAVEYNPAAELWHELIFVLRHNQATEQRPVRLAPELAQQWVDLWRYYRRETGAGGSILPGLSIQEQI